MYEVVRGGGYEPEAGVSFMLDQCHNVERKIPGQIRSVMNVQELTAKALLADLRAAQGLDPDPMAAYVRSGHDEKIVAERVGGAQAGWGA